MNKLIFSFCGLLMLIACATMENYSSEVTVKRKINSNSYELTGNGYSKKSESAISEAERNIFNIILFQGVAGSDLEIPMVPDESKSKSDKSSYYEGLIDRKGYRKFITKRSNTSTKIVKGGYSATTTLTVNYGALRKDLEQNGVIRKFGF